MLALVATLCLDGCVAGEGSGDTGGAARGTVSGLIRYAGPAAAPGRPLAIAAYRTYPPSGPPVRALLVERYTLPFRYELTDLPPGTYWIGALVDVDRTDTRFAGMLNAARDPHGYAAAGAPVTIAGDEGATGIDVDLEDPR